MRYKDQNKNYWKFYWRTQINVYNNNLNTLGLVNIIYEHNGDYGGKWNIVGNTYNWDVWSCFTNKYSENEWYIYKIR